MSRLLLWVVVAVFPHAVFSQDQTAAVSNDSGVQIRLVAPLDEPELYCVDLAGWGKSLKLDDPLQTHTCKSQNAADQMFSISGDHIKVSDYDRCLQIAGSSGITVTGSAVIARACSDENPLQMMAMRDDGKLQIKNTDYCLTAGTESAEASGPSHVWRTLSTIKCDAADRDLATWQLGLE